MAEHDAIAWPGRTGGRFAPARDWARGQNALAVALLLPTVTLIGVFVLFPLLQTIQISLTKDAINGDLGFVGINNYRRALESEGVPYAIRNSLIWGAAAMVLAPALGLGTAALVEDGPCRPKGLFRFLFFSPYLFAMAVAGAIFGRVYDPSYGLLNSMLREIGLGWFQPQWLGDRRLALGSAIGVFLWHEVPFCFLILSGAIRQIDRTLYDAAVVDGAHGFQIFRHVTIPSIRSTLSFVLLIMLIVGLTPFAVVFALTNPALGAPSYATEVPPTVIFKLGLLGTDYGQAAAVSVLLLTAIAIISVTFMRIRSRG